MFEIRQDYSIMYHNAVYQGVLYLEKYPNIKTLVIGLSGGIDSALSALLARRACDSIGKRVKLLGISLPIESNKKDEIERARKIGKSLCDSFIETDLTDPWKNLSFFLENKLLQDSSRDIDIKIRLGNSKARLRMMYLYNMAQANNGLVLSTDNLTEYYLGFWTLHGDVGDFCFIQNLWKTEVYGLAKWVTESFPTFNIDGMQECIDAIPTDGLGISDSDLHQLIPDTISNFKSVEDLNYRTLYGRVDSMLISYLNDKPWAAEDIDYRNVIRRLQTSQFKRENPYNVPREKLFAR